MRPVERQYPNPSGGTKLYFTLAAEELQDKQEEAGKKLLLDEIRVLAAETDGKAEKLTALLSRLGVKEENIPEEYKNNPEQAALDLETDGYNAFCKKTGVRPSDITKDARRLYGAQLVKQGFKNNAAAMIAQDEDEYVLPPLEAPDVQIRQICDIVPGLERLSEEKKAAGRDLQSQMCEKLTHLSHVYAAVGVYRSGLGLSVPRSVQAFIPYNDLSAESLGVYENFWTAFSTGSKMSKEEKVNAAAEIFKRLAKIDLWKLDPLNPQSMIDNAAEAMVVAKVGSEVVNMRSIILEQTGTDILTDKRFADFRGCYNVFKGLGTALTASFEMISSDFFPVFGFDLFQKVAENPQMNVTIKDEDGASVEHALNFALRELPIKNNNGETDPSAEAYIGQVYFNTAPTDKPRFLTDAAKSYDELFREFLTASKDNDGIGKYFPEPVVGQAAPTDFSCGDAHIFNMAGEAQIAADKSMFSAAGYSPAHFQPYCPGDAERLYIRSDDGRFVKAFPGFGAQGHAPLSDEQIKDVLTSRDKYVYFEAGETMPKVFRDGQLVELERLKSEEQNGFKFGADAAARMNGRLFGKEKKIFENEKRRHELDVAFFDLRRVDEMHRSIYGYNFDNVGDENHRNFIQKSAYYFASRPDAERGKYPERCGELTDPDITALTMLSFADPEVNGNKHEGVLPGSSVMTDFNMAVNDMYLCRANLESTNFIKSGFDARAALAPSLKNYSESGDISGLAGTIARGMNALGITCSNLVGLSLSNTCELAPAKRVAELLDSNPALLEGAKRYAKENDITTFDADFERLRISARLYDTAIKCLADERRLIAYETGEFTDKDGNVLAITDDERRKLEASRLKLDFLKENAVQHHLVCETNIPKDYDGGVQQRMMELAIQGKDVRHFADEIEFMSKSAPVSNVLRSIFTTENGEKVFDAILENCAPSDDYFSISRKLKFYGLIPGYEKLPENIEFGKTNETEFAKTDAIEPHFDFAKAADDCLELFSDKRIDEVKGNFGALLDEFGLSYTDIVSLSKLRNTTVEQYLLDLRAENELAEKNAPVRKDQEEKKIGDDWVVTEKADHKKNLSDFEYELAPESLAAMKPSELCRSLKELNAFSAEHKGDIYAEWKAGQFISQVCLKIHEHELRNPEFVTGKARYLRRQDFIDAQDCILRGRAAGAKLNAERLFEVPDKLIVDNLKNAQKGDRLISRAIAGKLDAINSYEQQVAEYDAMLEGTLGAQPGFSEAQLAQDLHDLPDIVELSEQTRIMDLPQNISEKAVMNLIRFNIVSDENLGKNTTDYSRFDAAHKSQCISMVVENVCAKRLGTHEIIKNSIVDARRGVKDALKAYTERRDPAPLGHIIANTFGMFTSEAISTLGKLGSSKGIYSIKNNLSVLRLLETNNDIMRSAKQQGLSEKTLELARCERELVGIRERSAASAKALLSENPPKGSALREKLADVLMEAIADSALADMTKAQDKLLDEKAAKANEKALKLAGGNRSKAAALLPGLIADEQAKVALNSDATPKLKLIGKYSGALRENLMKSTEFAAICEAADRAITPGAVLTNDDKLANTGKLFGKLLLNEKALSSTQKELDKRQPAPQAPAAL